MTWMAKWAGGFPIFLAEAAGSRVTDLDGHTYVDFALGDTGAMAGHSPPATVAAVRQRVDDLGGITAMLPTEDAAWVAGELTGALRPAALVLRPLGHGRQPLGAAARPPGDGTTARGVLRLQLPRHRRRDVRGARPRRPHRSPGRQRRPRGRPGRHHPGGRVERPRVGRGGAGRRTGRRAHHRAGPHQHRHRPSRARLPRGAPRALRPHRHAAADRRDPHALRRPGGLHAGVGPAARPRHARQVVRRRRADRGLRLVGRRGRAPGGARRRRGRGPRRRRGRGRHAGRQRPVDGGRPRHARPRCSPPRPSRA